MRLEADAEQSLPPSSLCVHMRAARRTLGVDDKDLGSRDADGEVADLVGVAVAKARVEGVVLRREQRADVLPSRQTPMSAPCISLAARACVPLHHYILPCTEEREYFLSNCTTIFCIRIISCSWGSAALDSQSARVTGSGHIVTQAVLQLELQAGNKPEQGTQQAGSCDGAGMDGPHLEAADLELVRPPQDLQGTCPQD